MSRENLQIVRSIYGDWERGNFRSTDWADPNIEWVWADGPTPGSRTGIAAMQATWRDFLSAWDDVRAEAAEYRALDDERVLVVFRRGGRGKTSGLDLDHMQSKGATLFELRGGKVTRLVVYHDGQQALADVGLTSADGRE